MKKNLSLSRHSISILIALFILLLSQGVLAWGGRGHHTICDAATFLVQNDELKKFLTTRPHVMGHLCNIPDIYWRNGDFNKEGAPTHYIDVEIIPYSIQDTPLDLQKLTEDLNGKKKANKDQIIRSLPHELGTLWWRADQFFKRSLLDKEALQKSKAGAKLEPKDEQDENNSFNKAVYGFFTNLGIMGHFVGDASQPFHSTDDYDGYNKGHGGIHSYYEEAVVAELDYDLQEKVYKEGKKLINAQRKEKFLTAKTVLEKMKALSILSFADIEPVLKIDKLVKPSEVIEEKGMKIRKAAQREPLSKTIKKFEPLVVKHMGRSAALLATLWDQAYLEAGSPNLSSYRSFKYPITPDFVMPDYYEIKKTTP